MVSPHLNNLPSQLSSFIGREHETAEVASLLANSRLVMLTGPGGCGKTRLALHVAGMVADRFADRVWFIPLASLAVPELLPQAVASALSLLEQPDRPLMDTLIQHLRTRQLLLVLDNCEHLIEPCAQLATNLLQACPDVRILATSREPLNIDGEFVWILPSLSVPPSSLAETELHKYDAVRLFLERASATGTTFQMTSDNAEHVIKICRRLDGIPLAIELAAARARALSLEQIATRLDDTMSVLTEGKRSAPLRHQTMRAALDWSYALLAAQEQILFRRLSVFAGGWTLEAAEQVNSDETQGIGLIDPAHQNNSHPSAFHRRPDSPKAFLQPSEILDLLTHLVDKSLVVMRYSDNQSATGREHTRYDLLEPTRQYARQKLTESGEATQIGAQHIAYFLRLVEEAIPDFTTPVQGETYDRLEREHDNLRAALRWALAQDEGEFALRLAAALTRFWQTRGYFHEGWQWLLQVLEAGRVHFRQHDTPAFQALYAKLQVHASRLHWQAGNYAAGLELAEAALRVFRLTGDRAWTAHSLCTLGRLIYQQGDDLEARRLVSESLALYRELGEKQGMVESLNQLAVMSLAQSDHEMARRLSGEAIALARQLGDLSLLSHTLGWRGRIALGQGELPLARDLIQEALRLQQRVGYKVGILESLITTASLADATAQPQRAVRLCGAVESLTAVWGARLKRTTSQWHKRNAVAARAQLAEVAFDGAWAEGQAMSMEQAIAEAHQVLSAVESTTTPSSAPAGPRDPNALTPRELEVLRLLVAGLSYEQIAEKLIVSRRTVNTHVTAVYGKLGVNSRSAASRYALEHKLV